MVPFRGCQARRAEGRKAAFRELARVVKPGGYLATAFKAGDSQVRRGALDAG
jgi:ubiquinone/menaquinone biosynthesis C-methylase UbiE